MSDAVAEVDANLPPLTKGHSIYSMAEAEASLPFMRKCVRENFRVTPVFTMPLERCVTAPEGVSISGCHFPQGVSKLCQLDIARSLTKLDYTGCMQSCFSS